MTIKASSYPTSRPTLDLNFAQAKRLDPRVTFTRSSTGSYFDANGVLQSAATNTARFDHNPATGESLGLLVEESRTNYAFHGEQFDNSVWSRTNVTVTPNGIIAPNGTITADTLAFSAGGSYVYQQVTTPTISAGQTLTYSAWVWSSSKAVIGIRVADTATGTMSGFQSVSLTGVAQRVSATVTATSNTTQWSIGFDNRVGLGGDQVAGSVNVWGAQLEVGSFPTSYIPTPATFTSRASSATYYDASGVIQTAGTNVARSAAFFPDSNGVMRSAGLLLEAASTNLVTYSEQFNQWTSSYVSVTANSVSAPDGATTADTVTADGTLNAHWIFGVDSTTGPKTFSVFAKAATNNFIQLLFAGDGVPYANFNLSTGAVGTTGSNSIASIQKLSNGWYRCSLSTTSTTATTPYIGIISSATSARAEANTLTTSVYLWGAQTEASPYPTSYIATTTATVTRSADVSSSATVTRSADVASITGTNFSSWYNQSEGTFYIDKSNLQNGTGNTATIFSLHSGGNANSYEPNVRIAPVDVFAVYVGFQYSFLTSSLPAKKHAFALKADNFAVSAAGATPVTDTSGALPALDSLFFNNYYQGNESGAFLLKRLSYWPVRLANATLQAITQ